RSPRNFGLVGRRVRLPFALWFRSLCAAPVMVPAWLIFRPLPAGPLRGRPMPDVAQSVAPLTSSNLSLFHLFLHAHWVVETVMLGLLVCSVWVWAIAIDKTFLFRRIRRAGEHFEQSFWSGQSLEDLYRSLSNKPEHSTG